MKKGQIIARQKLSVLLNDHDAKAKEVEVKDFDF
jgi:hypothetical protein